MATSLYKELTRIGIDDELAHNVDKALDPAHVATKEDVVIMQEAILQTQLKAESRYHELNNKIKNRGQVFHRAFLISWSTFPVPLIKTKFWKCQETGVRSFIVHI